MWLLATHKVKVISDDRWAQSCCIMRHFNWQLLASIPISLTQVNGRESWCDDTRCLISQKCKFTGGQLHACGQHTSRSEGFVSDVSCQMSLRLFISPFLSLSCAGVSSAQGRPRLWSCLTCYHPNTTLFLGSSHPISMPAVFSAIVIFFLYHGFKNLGDTDT